MNNNNTRTSAENLLKHGNTALLRLLLVLNKAGSKGLPTSKLVRDELHSVGYGQVTLKRAIRLGLVTKIGERGKHQPPTGQFEAVYNVITPKGIELLKSLVPPTTTSS
jgi:hypothetical protein